MCWGRIDTNSCTDRLVMNLSVSRKGGANNTTSTIFDGGKDIINLVALNITRNKVLFVPNKILEDEAQRYFAPC